MTFDDGPHPVLTPRLLDMLKARGIKATFFLIGQNAAEYPDIVRRIAAEGHEIGNHTWNHPQLTKLSPAALREEIDRTSSTIAEIIGKPLHVMRPPYDATSDYINHWINREFGMKVILWSVDPLDWKYRNFARVESQILAGARPGAIILSHDIHATTVAAMPDVFDSLLAKGYKICHRFRVDRDGQTRTAGGAERTEHLTGAAVADRAFLRRRDCSQIRTNCSRLRKLLVHEVPVYQVPPGRNIIRTPVLILQVVGVLPHINAKKRQLSIRDRRILVGRRENFELSIFCREPRPAAAKTLYRSVVELLLELVE